MRRSWMLAHLAQQTQPLHAAADGDRLVLMERSTVERYRTLVTQIYCFEAPVEAACVATAGFPERFLRTHAKCQALAADLEALGIAAREAVPVDGPRFDSAAEALAWVWVLHRNTLLHGLIYRYLASKLPETMRKAGSYLSAFEGRAGALMRELGDALDEHARRASIAERMVAAARDAFRIQHQWYSCDVLAPEHPRRKRPTFATRAA